MMSAATWTSSLATLILSAVATWATPSCDRVLFDGESFTVCRVDPATDDVRLYLDDDTGAKIGTFRRLQDDVEKTGRRLVLAMNAGMYHPDRRPVGLYIEDGVEKTPVVTRKGPGNFGLLPNGVLCLSETGASVLESRVYAADPPSCRHATQSGPMLVIDGRLHPRFIRGGSSKNIRNGVGVTRDGTLVMAISDGAVNFDTFGRLFRDGLDTPNALYLDGRISRLYAPDLDRADGGFPMGPILAVTVPAD